MHTKTKTNTQPHKQLEVRKQLINYNNRTTALKATRDLIHFTGTKGPQRVLMKNDP